MNIRDQVYRYVWDPVFLHIWDRGLVEVNQALPYHTVYHRISDHLRGNIFSRIELSESREPK